MFYDIAITTIDGAGLFALFATIRELGRNHVSIINALRGRF